MSYFAYNHDNLQPMEKLIIERRVYFDDKKVDIAHLAALPVERLQAMREESAAAEQAIFENLQGAAKAWEAQAGETLSLSKAIEYNRTPAVIHSSNQWGADHVNSDRQSISNMVYKMTYHISEQKMNSKPYAWDLTWSVRTNDISGYRGERIAGQSNKRYGDKAEMEKYLNGRIKAYSHLFTEISPPIPPGLAKHFQVNGQLLPGYTIEGEEPKPPAADITVGGDSVSERKISEPRKENENMNEPLSIQLVTPDMERGINAGVWLKLPATAEQLQAALARIGSQGGEQGKDYIISSIESPITAVFNLPLENVQAAGIDELNYLAARLEAIAPVQLEKLKAAALVMSYSDNVHRLVEYTHNTDFFIHNPSVFNHTQLGEHCLNDSELCNIPEEWKGAVDVERLGQIVATTEKGVFTEHGYIYPTGDDWKPVHEIPQEYLITPKHEQPERQPGNETWSEPATPENAPDNPGEPSDDIGAYLPEQDNPNVEQDAIATRTPAATTAKPPAQAQAAVVVAAAPFVLVADNPRDKLKEITDKLENGIKGIFESDQYKSYLQTLAKFHNYSMNNCLLIALQKPDATHVGGFNFWRDEMKRPVMKGEKGIKIIAPSPFKTKKTVDAVDANGKPVFKDGKRVKEEQEITVPAFKVTTVFDVSQTDGEPMPQIGVNELTGSVDKYKDFFAALEKTSPVPIGFEAIKTGAKGYYHLEEKRIALNEGMSELQNLKTAIHEIAHSRLHAIDKNAPKDVTRPDQRTREVEAESIAYTVCQHYGLDTSDYSFGYVAGWSGGKQLDTLKSSLDTIRKEADAIITEVDKHFAELTKGKEQTAEQGDTFTIYQLKDGDQTRNLRFEPLDRLKAPPDFANYENMCVAPLDKNITLENIYQTFNVDRPEGFKGHSLSVSDIVVMNRDGKETAFYVDSAGFKELPDLLNPKEQAAEKPAPAFDLKTVADYMQKQHETIQAADPDKTQGQAAFRMAVKRLEQATGRIPDEHPQLKALLSHAAQSPDLATLKERMNTLQTEFTQHYSTAVQMTIDTSGKAEPPTPAAPVRQTDAPPAPKPPAQGENVAAIEAKVKAGETINLSDLNDAIKKGNAAARTAQTPAKSGTRGAAKKGDWKTAHAQDSWDRAAQGKSAVKPVPEKPSIKEQIAAGKQQLAAQKPAPSRAAAQTKTAEIGG